MKKIAIIILLTALVGCKTPEPATRRGHHDRVLIKQAILTDLGVTPKAATPNRRIFIMVPPEEAREFAALYASLSPVVKVCAEGRERAEFRMVDGAVVDAETGLPGVVYNVSITEIANDWAKASGGFFYGDLGGASYSYELVSKLGKWTIKQRDLGTAF